MAEHFDIIIIGTGAGGGTLAHTLAPSGKRILLLERGDFLPREMDNWSPKAVFEEGKYISEDTWYDADGKAFQPQVHYFVGGATKMYGAALYRLRPGDFQELKHVDGISPSWPLGYDDFEPWYTRAEMAVPSPWCARGGSDRGPLEPPVPVAGRLQRATDPTAVRRPGRGRVPPVPRALRHPPGREARPASTCIRCTWCDGYPCLVHAKSDAEVIAVRPALDHDNVSILVNAEVVKLETDSARTHRDRSRRLPGGCPRDVCGRHRRAVGRRVEQRQACSPRQTTAIRRAWPTGRIRSGETTCTTTARPWWPCRRKPTTPSSRRRSRSTTSTSGLPTTTGRWVRSRWSASRTPRR